MRCRFVPMVLLFMPLLSTGQTVKRIRSAKLASISAQLFYSNTGTFSGNILDNPNFALWNTIIGEGSAAGPSTSTFVLVKLVGDGRKDFLSADVLTVTTQAEGKASVKRRIDNLNFSKGGEYYEGTWLYGTGCLPLTITVQVNQQPPVKRKIDFRCGE